MKKLHFFLKNILEKNKLFIFVSFIILTNNTFSLPIGFNINQGNIKYNEKSSENFRLFFDERTPHEAKMILEAVESALPILENWFDIKNKNQISIISSAVSNYASFANFITETIEYQTMGFGSKELFWHELVHMMMYKYFYNIFGSSGAIIHLAWIPTWLIEGLAEMLSHSANTTDMLSYERYFALSKNWPSYDRLHNLYGGNDFSHTGYIVSGNFVTWLFKKASPGFLPRMLKDIYKYTMPWYYFLSANPFSSFLPVDKALKNEFNLNGRELYEIYKKEMTLFWQEKKEKPLLVTSLDKKLALSSLGKIETITQKPILSMTQDQILTQKYEVIFDKESSWMIGLNEFKKPYSKFLKKIIDIPSKKLRFFVRHEKNIRNNLKKTLLQISSYKNEDKALTFFTTEGQISHIRNSGKKIIWLERNKGISKLCYINISNLETSGIKKEAIECPVIKTLPEKISFLGSQNMMDEDFDKLKAQVWFKVENKDTYETKHKIFKWLPNSDQIIHLKNLDQIDAISFIGMDDTYWLLIREKDRNILQKFYTNNICEGFIDISDHILKANSYFSKEIILALYHGENIVVKKIDPNNYPLKICKKIKKELSPIEYALKQKDNIPNLQQALNKEDNSKIIKNIALTAKTEVTKEKNKQKATPYRWGGRPLFLFPVLYSSDITTNKSLGPIGQIGFVSVPFMDYLQNETVRFDFSWGVYSNYPNFHLNLTSKRFQNSIFLDLYKLRSWNGYYKNKISYIDKTGSQLSLSYSFYNNRWVFSILPAISFTKQKQYLGQYPSIEGLLTLLKLNLNYTYLLYNWTLNLAMNSSIAPRALNKKYEYNKFGLSLKLLRKFDFIDSTLSFSLSGGRVRGVRNKTPLLKQYYIPLNTYISGGNTSLTNNSFPLFGEGSLFYIRLGSDTMKSSLTWNIPVLKNINTLFWILYLKRLDFSAFLNYGGAWYENHFNSKYLIPSHGYNLDLFLENKGINFNTGLGLGQVFGDPLQVYFRFGFTALF